MATVRGGERLAQWLRQAADGVAKDPTVKIGFLSGATYPDGQSVAAVAAFNEFGVPSRGQPPRPFFRGMVARQKGSWASAIAQNLAATHYDARRTLDRMGQGIKGQLQQSIVELRDPPLSPSTVKAKGFDTPLIDTGHMLNSVDYEVID